MKAISALACVLLMSVPASGGESSRDDLEAAMQELSATMMIDGPGWEAYRSQLHPSFTRWNRNGEVVGRDAFIDSLREWWEGGYRVAEGDSRIVGISVADGVAIVRLERTERFVDRKGAETGRFRGFVTQVWVSTQEGWRLLSVDVAS